MSLGPPVKNTTLNLMSPMRLLAQSSTLDEMACSQRAALERWGPLVKRIGFTADS